MEKFASAAWDLCKDDLERIAAELAERRKIAPSALFRPNESVFPANKPG